MPNEVPVRGANGCAWAAEFSVRWREWIGSLDTLVAAEASRWQRRGRALNRVVPADVADETAGRGVAHATEDSYT